MPDSNFRVSVRSPSSNWDNSGVPIPENWSPKPTELTFVSSIRWFLLYVPHPKTQKKASENRQTPTKES